jgi:transposase
VAASGFDIVSVLRLGGLPAIKKFCDRLRLAEIIDEVVPVATQARMSHGQTFVALVMNKLTDSRPLYRVRNWAEGHALEYVLKVSPELLTDDRLARMLDAVADHAESLKTSICLQAIQEFDLDMRRVHWDLTSFEFSGVYEDQEEAFPTLTYGYSSSGVGQHIQCRVGNLVCGDGAVGGLLHKTYSGITSDQNSVLDYLSLLLRIQQGLHQERAAAAGPANQESPTPSTITLVGDSKLLSHESMVMVEKAGLKFIFPEPSSKQLKELYESVADLNHEDWRPLDYVSERELRDKKNPNTDYRYREAVWTYESIEQDSQTEHNQPKSPKGGRPRKPRVTHRFRRLIIYSSANRVAQQKNRDRHRLKFEKQLEELNEKFQTAWWKNKSKETAEKAVTKIRNGSKMAGFYEIALAPGKEGGWTLTWTLNEAALAEAGRTDGLYTLITNISSGEATADAIFRDYKRQTDAERRFADWKSPLQVNQIFLKSNKRVAGMVFVMAVALLIFCLMERQVRKGLPDGKMVGLLPINQPTKATGWNILDTLSTLQLVGIKAGGRMGWQETHSNETQRQLLALLLPDLTLNKGSPG